MKKILKGVYGLWVALYPKSFRATIIKNTRLKVTEISEEFGRTAATKTDKSGGIFFQCENFACFIAFKLKRGNVSQMIPR